jgi:tetratricopeptide (TPR) repeat protein
MMSEAGTHLNDADEFFRQGLALAKQGRWKEALKAYQESLRINPGSVQTYLNLGFVYYELGYDREAQEAFGTASRLQAGSCVR